MTHRSSPDHCPDCGRPLPARPQPAHCPQCALPLTGPAFDRLRWAVAELHRLDRQRETLTAHRRELVGQLRAGPASPPGPGAGPQLHPPEWPAAAAGPVRAETSPGTARNVLLLLGGVLLTVAALAFTLLSWGQLGIGGRAAVLATVTLAAGAAPAVLLRRKLAATAEAVAGVALVLLLLDAYALRQVSLQDTGALRYAAGAAAVVALLWAVYGLLLPQPGLRVPLPAAVALAQLPILLWAASTGAGPHGMAWALLTTAAADVLLAVALAGRPWWGAVRVAAAVMALVTGVLALLLAGWLSLGAQDVAAAARVGALLVTAAGVMVLAGRRERAFGMALSCAAGVLLIVASGGLVRTLVPSAAWVVPGYLLCAVGLAAAAASARVPKGPSSAGLLWAAALMHAVALVYGLPALTQALLEPPTWAVPPWQGAPPTGEGWAGDAGTPVLFAVPAVVLVLAGRRGLPDAVRRPATAGAVALGGAAAVVAPLSLGLPYAGATAWLVVLVVGLLVLSVTGLAAPAGGWDLAPASSSRPEAGGESPGPRGPADGSGATVSVTATVAALVAGLAATGWALADRTATFAVLSVLAAAFAAAGVRAAGRGPAGGAVPSVLCAATAVLCAAGLARAFPAALGAPPEQAAFAVLALAAATAPLAARLRGVRPGSRAPAASLAVECAGYAVAGWALVLAASNASLLALALGLCGVLAGVVALRTDRRPAGYAATGLFLLATWVRLYASEVTVPEAYGLPLAVAAFGVGVLRARRDPRTSSWTAYGPALSCGLLPSLVMVWGDPHWLRPLLLGAGALAVTLLGARLRLQAPLLAGGVVLGLVTAHELAPYVVQVIGLLPRWLPPALAGLLLLALGATYEHRLRDARRLHAAWRRLH